MLKLREFSDATGALSALFLRQASGVLEIVGDGDAEKEPTPLPEGALAAVMARYGAPFDPDATISVIATLDLGDGGTLRHVRHLAGYDVIARDYLVYDAAGREPVCALSVAVARALEHLAAAVRARRAQAGSLRKTATD
jgi:hypothetical protein